MKILLFGANGQVGWELQRSLSPLGQVIALDRHSTQLCGDLANLPGIADAVRLVRPDVIVNAAAYTAVDKAESDIDNVHAINALAPGVLAVAAKAVGAWIVHYSTDYVFDGSGSKPWIETDPTGPLNVYGRTKLEGERRVAESGARHLIFRTCWVHSAIGENFIQSILKLALKSNPLCVLVDPVGAPTSAKLVADITANVLRFIKKKGGADDLNFSGLYHLCSDGEVSRHAYAQWIVHQARLRGMPLTLACDEVQAITSANVMQLARRPANSRLNCHKLNATFGLALPIWQSGVADTINEISWLWASCDVLS